MVSTMGRPMDSFIRRLSHGKRPYKSQGLSFCVTHNLKICTSHKHTCTYCELSNIHTPNPSFNNKLIFFSQATTDGNRYESESGFGSAGKTIFKMLFANHIPHFTHHCRYCDSRYKPRQKVNYDFQVVGVYVSTVRSFFSSFFFIAILERVKNVFFF